MINNQNEMSMNNRKVKIIKRYQNRKLYDTQQSCYVTLDDIAKMIRASEDVMVIDNKSKNDITAATLTQIIFEAEKKASQYAPLFTLREIIQNGNGSISSYLAKLGAFPQEYITQQQNQQARLQEQLAAEQKTSTDSIKESIETRVANAAAKSAGGNSVNDTAKMAAEKAATGYGSYDDDETPSLPGQNLNINN